jgi:hypothetical protein
VLYAKVGITNTYAEIIAREDDNREVLPELEKDLNSFHGKFVLAKFIAEVFGLIIIIRIFGWFKDIHEEFAVCITKFRLVNSLVKV